MFVMMNYIYFRDIQLAVNMCVLGEGNFPLARVKQRLTDGDRDRQRQRETVCWGQRRGE